eukprot:4174975-Amphidinium_carterae.1
MPPSTTERLASGSKMPELMASIKEATCAKAAIDTSLLYTTIGWLRPLLCLPSCCLTSALIPKRAHHASRVALGE